MYARNQTEKISNMVRSVSISGDGGSARNTPTPTAVTPWDTQTTIIRSPSNEPGTRPLTSGRDAPPSLRDSGGEPPSSARLGPKHMRSDSDATGGLTSSQISGPPPPLPSSASGAGYAETMASGSAISGGPPPPMPQPPRSAGGNRPHEYDVQMMETAATPLSPRTMTRNPIPAPTVTVRSEFPTVSRSRQQQTLTCLVTVEVPEGKWRPDPEDLGGFVPPPLAPSLGGRTLGEDSVATAGGRPPSPARSAPRFYPYESPEVLDEMTENLRSRVDNWHGLDFSR